MSPTAADNLIGLQSSHPVAGTFSLPWSFRTETPWESAWESYPVFGIWATSRIDAASVSNWKCGRK